MKENLKFRLDLLQALLAKENDQQAKSKLWVTQFAALKAKANLDPDALEKEIRQIKRTLAERKIHHAVAEVRRSLKVNKSVEVLKLKKRAKNSDKKKNIEEETEVANKIDIEDWSKDIVYRQVQKYFDGIVQYKKPTMTTAESNVYARMCKATAIKGAIDALLSTLREWYEPKEGPNVGSRIEKLDAQKALREEEPMVVEQDEIQTYDQEANESKAIERDTFFEEEEAVNGPDDEQEDDEPEHDDFFDQDIEIANTDSEDEDAINPDFPGGLPMLQQGYVSGSEDDEPEPDAAPVRKNRRGQRARRKIWEMKYGSGAKHVVKEKQEYAKKQAQKEQRRQYREQKAKEYEAKKEAKAKAANDIESLHPSWQAKIRQKEAERNVKFEGKKITFD